eukprot:3926853-Rhodomonas_salina.3
MCTVDRNGNPRDDCQIKVSILDVGKRGKGVSKIVLAHAVRLHLDARADAHGGIPLQRASTAWLFLCSLFAALTERC